MTLNRHEYDKLAFNEQNDGYFFTQGFVVGYEWLNPDKPYAHNFRHPGEKGGYIPGGPSFGLFVRRGKGWERDNPQDVWFASVASRAWRGGFIRGINAYVRDNDLDYPEVKE